MDLREVKHRLIRYESFRPHPYKCSAGYLTIGYGRNLETNGITVSEGFSMMENDIYACLNDLVEIFGAKLWNHFTDNQHHALIDMRYNLGSGGFRSFKRMIEAIKRGYWQDAVIELENSLYWKQVSARAKENQELFLKDYNELPKVW